MKWYQDSDGNTSSKRLIGGIGFTIYLVIRLVVLPIYSIYSGNDLGNNVSGGIDAAGAFCAGLIGLGVAEKFAPKKEIAG